MIGSRSTAPASWAALRKASEAAKRKARSLESSSWVAPSMRVTFKSTSGYPVRPPDFASPARARLDRGEELGRDDPSLGPVHEVEHRGTLGLGLGFEVDGDLGVEAGAAGLADAGSLHPLDRAPDRLAVADPRPAHVDLQLEITDHPVLEDLQVQLPHAGDQRLAGLLVDPELERRILARQGVQGLGELPFIRRAHRLDRHADDRLGELDPLQEDRVRAVAEGV